MDLFVFFGCFNYLFNAVENYILFSNSSPPAYQSTKARDRNLLRGANFASAASGYYEATANLYVYNKFTKNI